MVAVLSRNLIPIRLTDERWEHIIAQHTEMAQYRTEILDTIQNPHAILAGNDGELMAISETEIGKWLIVVYREFENDGFIITSFFTRRKSSLEKRKVIWSQ